jgi:hypothetical protein
MTGTFGNKDVQQLLQESQPIEKEVKFFVVSLSW